MAWLLPREVEIEQLELTVHMQWNLTLKEGRLNLLFLQSSYLSLTSTG